MPNARRQAAADTVLSAHAWGCPHSPPRALSTADTGDDEYGAQRQAQVYRAAMGFHDVYVAAPSRKAALEAWGSEHDLFSRGIAEVVIDPELTERPLAQPGVVVKRLRGSAAEQIAALPSDTSPTKAVSRSAPKPPKHKATPPPSRSEVEKAEQALAAAEARHSSAAEALGYEEAQLQRKRRDLEKAQAAEIQKLRRSLERVNALYDKAVRNWRG